MMPEKFYLPWGEIDPSLMDGGIPGELAANFVGPDLGDNPTTMNGDMVSVFNEIRNATQSISMSPEAMKQGTPGRRIVEEGLRALNSIFEKIVDVTHTNATRFHEWNHAVPPNLSFALAPIRFPLRQEFANEFVHFGLGSMVETAEMNRNANHSGIDPNSAEKIIAPFYYWKSKIMKYYFDLEVAGEVSVDELEVLFEGKYRPGPTVSLPDDSAERPDGADMTEALTGTDVLQWYPSREDWAVFARLSKERYVPERIFQPEGSLATTEDVAPHVKVTSGGQPMIGAGRTQP